MGVEQMDQVYELKARADSLFRATKKPQAEGDMEGAKRLVEANRSALQLRPHLEAMTQQLAKLRKQYSGVYNSPNLSPEEKGQQLDRIREMQLRISARVEELRRMAQQ
jgi:hypothetical protein